MQGERVREVVIDVTAVSQFPERQIPNQSFNLLAVVPSELQFTSSAIMLVGVDMERRRGSMFTHGCGLYVSS